VRRRCAYSGELVEGATLVGTVDRTSGPSKPIYACDTCMAILNLLPLADHPHGSNGLPQRADGQPVPTTGATPVLVHYGKRAS
jgi:hypothetical protein